jgi:ankyrin repeat protein
VTAGLLWVSSAAASDDLRLVDAAKNQNTALVATLLKQRVDVNGRQPDGATALHWAAHWDDVKSAEQLIRAGADVNATNDYGVTPLLLACSDASAAMVARLLDAGANPKIALPSGETALMAAARTGKVEAVNVLLAHGADVNAKETMRGQTALMWAVAEGHVDVVKALLELGADLKARSNNKSTALLLAARQGDPALARLLLAHGADVKDTNATGTSVLLMATVRGHAALAQMLLEQGADPNADAAGYTPLHWAANKWETEFTTDYSFAPGTTEEWAAVAGLQRADKLALIKALLVHGANVNARLKKAPPQSSRTLARYELMKGGTPFYLAAMSGDTEVMRVLLEAGADPRLTANDGTTPLLVAAGLAHEEHRSRIPDRDFLEAVQFLLDHGADVKETNEDGWTPLHVAAFTGRPTVAQYLVEHGADLNAKTKFGQTSLGIAEGYCKLRLDKEKNRVEPMAGCIIAYRPEMAELLHKWGAVSAGKVALDLNGQLVVASADVASSPAQTRR